MPHAAGVAIIFPVAHRVVKFDIISSDREEERKEDSEPGGTKRGTRLEIDEGEEEEERCTRTRVHICRERAENGSFERNELHPHPDLRMRVPLCSRRIDPSIPLSLEEEDKRDGGESRGTCLVRRRDHRDPGVFPRFPCFRENSATMLSTELTPREQSCR